MYQALTSKEAIIDNHSTDVRAKRPTIIATPDKARVITGLRERYAMHQYDIDIIKMLFDKIEILEKELRHGKAKVSEHSISRAFAKHNK